MPGGDWEVRGLFGNEYALERAVDEIKKMEKPPEFAVLDRRNLRVVLSKNDSETKQAGQEHHHDSPRFRGERRPLGGVRQEEGGSEGKEAQG